jgi:formate hydrogenlyase transcriptional activator
MIRVMPTENPNSAMARLDPGTRHRLVLTAWEAVARERELAGVLAAISRVLVQYVSFDCVGVVTFREDPHRVLAVHVVGFEPREHESWEEYAKRINVPPHPPLPPKPRLAYEHDVPSPPWYPAILRHCPDLLESQGWYDHEFYLAKEGARAYAALALFQEKSVVGTMVFWRMEPGPFSEEQLALLSDVSVAVSVAVVNALANEEIRKLRDQLEAENIELRKQLGEAPWFENIVGDSPALRRVLEAVEQVAFTDATVLITGETGTGKELIARAIHRRSPRAHGPLVQVNCSAIPDTLLASELFGHERGAFTGAVERRKGRFEQAHGGTLFLDEIGELSPEAQVMLLRTLQEREFERLGGTQRLQVDVRLVAATNRSLEEEMRQGRFRHDLFYRLNVFPIHVPALRERAEDIPVLAATFADKFSQRFNRPIERLEKRSVNLLMSYHWPGNVRELENVIERAVIVSRGGTLRIERDALQPGPPAGAAAANLPSQLETQEREMIEVALRAARGRIAGQDGAARRLGLAPSTLEFRIKKLGIDKFYYRTQHNN